MPNESEIFTAVHGQVPSMAAPRQPLPGMQIDAARYGGRPVKHPQGLLSQGDFRPAAQRRRWPFPVVQSAPPPSRPSCPVCSVPGRTEVGVGLICPICGRRVS